MATVEELIESLPSEERTLVRKLRSIILDCDSRIQEKLSYGVPYFYHHRRICFLWPASCVPGAEKKPPTTEKVTLGFCYGNLLSNDQRVLLVEGRKQVYLIKYGSLKQIDERIVREIIHEAILVDDSFKKR